MRYFFLLFLVLSCTALSAQDNPPPDLQKSDTLKRKSKKARDKGAPPEGAEITIADYKIISFARDTTFLDTTLTIQKEYKYNYLRKDDFELMPFANIGQPYNKLGVDLDRLNLYPKLGAKAKHANYWELEDIDYYNVATPLSDLMFKTTFEQGQMLDAKLAFNTSRRLNFSIGYKSLRSLGKYRFNQGESGNFTTTTNYVTKNGRYQLRAHIAAQDVKTEENGGLPLKELQFESADPEFNDRVKLDIRFADAQNKLLGKRYFLDHKYKLIRTRKDSSRIEKTSLAIGHQFNYETKFYQYTQAAQNTYFGEGLLGAIDDRMNLKTMYNQLSADFYNATLGSLQGNISLYNYNYFTNSLLITEDQTITNQLEGQEVALGATYRKQIKGFLLKGSVKYNLSGTLTGNILDASASYSFNDKHKVKAAIHSSSRMPDFNFLLYQSDYVNYNWQNTNTFENERVNALNFDFQSKVWGNLSAKFTTTDNYAYFSSDPSITLVEGSEQASIKPFQETNSVNYLKLKYSKEIKVGGFALSNTVMYQDVQQTNKVLNVPQLVTRNTLYFSSHVFKKAMFLQTGVTLKYFTSYTMDAYNPVLGEFYIQNTEELGGFPMLDFFINAKVQQTRIFLKAEHFNSSFGDTNSFYAAPNYPYRDFVIRFGLVWNFFS
ncbi:putative porin [Maribacter sp. 2307UL18-2]|uniref:putative porin n=1 Tax=Maribacter sp. 2307UL18-2 TaxID=3386274 RepID=UPI0039BCDDAD